MKKVADAGEAVVRVPAIRDMVQVELAVRAIAVNVRNVVNPYRAVTWWARYPLYHCP